MIKLPPVNWLSLLPAIIPAFTGILMLCWDLGMKNEERHRLAWLGILGLAITAVVSFCLLGRNEPAFNGSYALDSYAMFFNLIFCLAGILTFLMSIQYLHTSDIHAGEYYALIMFAIVGMVVMAAATDLINIFLGLETMSIAVYVLVGIWRQRLQSNEAALKYFLLGAFASGFLLYGIALLYGATGSVQLGKIAMHVNEHGASTLLLIGVAMLIVGFGFKVAAAPFHVWTPDVYEGAPTTITAFMAVGVKAAAFAAFARVFLYALGGIHGQWGGVLWVLAVLTMTVGNITALVQNNVKRMLAYSSIAHAGYLLVAMVAGKELGGAALMYYLVAYGLMNLGAFGVIIAVGRKGEPNEEFADFAGLGFRYPLLALAMTVFMLSLTGIPPLVGFVGKFYIFSAAVKAGYLWLAVIGVLNSAISAYYYVRVIVSMYMHEGDKVPEKLSARPALAVAILIAAVGTIWLGVFPSASMALTRLSFLSLG
ncbi:MAG: NADH-quinone oxidoreductase subunit N [Deltaproteobacteria bacterium]|nr:NADH-quinone oxidoreductase subunit N [Deltaproteobacteria bacterium]